MYNLRLLAGLAVLVASSISVSAQIASPKPPVVVITPPGPSTKIGMLTRALGLLLVVRKVWRARLCPTAHIPQKITWAISQL
jgi:hypothetical protein